MDREKQRMGKVESDRVGVNKGIELEGQSGKEKRNKVWRKKRNKDRRWKDEQMNEMHV